MDEHPCSLILLPQSVAVSACSPALEACQYLHLSQVKVSLQLCLRLSEREVLTRNELLLFLFEESIDSLQIGIAWR